MSTRLETSNLPSTLRGFTAEKRSQTSAGPPGELGWVEGTASAGNSVSRVAFLTNAYPKVSHSFIRDEILALERAGLAIERTTIRGAPETLLDPLDRDERTRTTVLLDGRWSRLLGSALFRALRSPLRFVRAASAAVSLAARCGPLRSFAYLAEACRLVGVLERRGIRHIHVHFGTNPATVARLAAKLAPVSYSLTVHGPDEFDAPLALDLPGKIAEAKFVVAVSSYGRAQLMRWSAPHHWPRIKVVRCGTDGHFLRRPTNLADDAGLRSHRLVCVARLSAQKGIPLLIEAAGMLPRECPFELRIIGDGELRAEIEAQIVHRGLDRQVKLLGWQDRKTIVEEILAARALVLPSFAEGLPVVLMEALALNRPVITTGVAGIPELVDGKTGWVIPAGSPAALADAMQAALLADAATLASMGAAGCERVRRNHDVDRNAARLAQLLKPLV